MGLFSGLKRGIAACVLEYHTFVPLDDLKEACKAVESYLLFHPSDGTMLSNKNYYLSLPEVEENYFQPRKDAKNYVKRQEYEKLLLLYVDQKFQALEDKIVI